MLRFSLLWLAIFCVAGAVGLAATPLAAKTAQPSVFDPGSAIAYSQAAVGREIGDYSFLDRSGEARRLSDFRGKPLVVNLVFTACVESCPIIVQTLQHAVDVAMEALGENSFSVVTIGFDSAQDTPERMHDYASNQGIDFDNWHFLSGAGVDMEQLLEELGFLYFPSPRGFDHLAQTSVLSSDGIVHQQVYGASFEAPALVEPLKSLMFDQAGSLVDVEALIERVRLFCTFYDPARDRYSFDYSFFFAMTIGGLSLLGVAMLLLRALLAARLRERGSRTPPRASEIR